MTVMRKLTLLLLCLALGIGVCDAKKKNRGVYFRTDAEIVLDKPYFGLNVSNMIQVVLEADRNPRFGPGRNRKCACRGGFRAGAAR